METIWLWVLSLISASVMAGVTSGKVLIGVTVFLILLCLSLAIAMASRAIIEELRPLLKK